MNKKISIGKKPTVAPSADAWISDRVTAAEETEKMKRLTIDIPESLHKAIKMQTAERGTKIADEVRELLIQKYGKS